MSEVALGRFERSHAERILGWTRYRGAGFVRTSPQEEATFNRGQPDVYVWMRRA